MAPRKSNAAHIESLGESMTPEETSLMSDNQAAERQPEPELQLDPAPAPEAKEDAPAAQAAPKADAQPDIDPETGKQRKVDYGAFHAERQKRQTTEAELQKAREELAKFNGRFETLQQLAQQTKAPAQTQEVTVPDVNVDPVGHFKALYEQSQNKINDLDRWRQTQEGERTAMNNVQQLTRIALGHEAEFAKKTPDYQDAAAYVRQMRDQELDYMGYKDPAVRQQIIQQDALQIAAQALQGNLNAAEVVYNIAKSRGYAAKAPAPAAPPAPAEPSADAKKIATVAKGQAASQSLGQVNGSSVPETSVQALLQMSDTDFEAATKGDNWRKLFA